MRDIKIWQYPVDQGLIILFMDASDALLLPMSWCQTPGHRRQKKEGKKILIQLSLFYIDAAQNKTKLKNKKKIKK